MKKILFYILITALVFGFGTKNSFARDCLNSCTIQSEPAKILQEYIQNNRKLISNISSKLAKSNNGNQSILVKEGLRIYNSIIDWSTFSSSLEFFKLNLQGEVPYPIKRDLQFLENESQRLNDFLKYTIQNGFPEANIENVCNGIINCELSGNAGNVIGDIIKNHNKIIEFYRLSILGREAEFNTNISLVPNNFQSELNNHYNKYTISDCSNCEGAFSDRINKAITKFFLHDKAGKDGIKEWKEAWDLLTGSRSNEREFAEIESQLLEKELSKQGVDSSNGDSILDNLDDYNNNGYSSQNNPLNNSFSSFKNNVDTSGSMQLISTFKQTVGQIYKNFVGYIEKTREHIPIAQLAHVESNIEDTISIINEIDALYQREVPFISKQDLNSKKLQARIIKLHVDLSQAINIVDKTKPLSEKVCNDQDRGNGKCKY